MVVLSEHLLNLKKGANSATDNTEKKTLQNYLIPGMKFNSKKSVKYSISILYKFHLK